MACCQGIEAHGGKNDMRKSGQQRCNSSPVIHPPPHTHAIVSQDWTVMVLQWPVSGNMFRNGE